MVPTITLSETKGKQDMLQQISMLGKVPARMLTRQVLRDIMRPTFASAKQLVPQDKGALAASLKLRAISRTRRGIGVLIQSTGALTRAQAKKRRAFSGDQFYGSFVHWGHSWTKRTKAIRKLDYRVDRDYRRGEISPIQRAVAKANVRGNSRRFPGIPFLKEAGQMHEARMTREIIERINDGIAEAINQNKI